MGVEGRFRLLQLPLQFLQLFPGGGDGRFQGLALLLLFLLFLPVELQLQPQCFPALFALAEPAPALFQPPLGLLPLALALLLFPLALLPEGRPRTLGQGRQLGFGVALVVGQGGQLEAELVQLPALPAVAAVGQGTLQFLVGRGRLGLAGQPLTLGRQLAEPVIVALQMGADLHHAFLGFPAATFIDGDAGGLLQKTADFLGPGLDDAANHALFDDRIAARTDPHRLQQFDHVPAAHHLLINLVEGGTAAAQLAADADFIVGPEGPADAAVAVVKEQFHRGGAGGGPGRGAGEEHVVGAGPAQLLHGVFAQHPAHGVDDVALATAVGADDAGQRRVQGKGGGRGKGFEPLQFDGG